MVTPAYQLTGPGEMSTLRTVVLSIGLGVASALPIVAQVDSTWTEAFPPFRIAGNLYYVGTKALASYLVATPNGLILINSDLEQNVPQIKASIEHLGFKFSDVRILLISHAHFDHDAGSAKIKPSLPRFSEIVSSLRITES